MRHVIPFVFIPLSLFADIFEAGSRVTLSSEVIAPEAHWLFDSSNHYFSHYPSQAVPFDYSSYFEKGSYKLDSLSINQFSAQLNSTAYATSGYSGGTGYASRTATVTLTSPFSATYTGTRTELGVTESFNGNLTIYPAQDYAPEAMPIGSVWNNHNAYYYSATYSGPAGGGSITILSDKSLQRYDPESSETNIESYTYTKLGPNLASISVSDPASSVSGNINLFFRSPTEVYYYGDTTDSYGSYTDWGAMSVSYPSSYSPPAIFPAPSILPQDHILQITGTHSDLSLDLAGGAWTDASGGSGSFTYTYAVQAGGVAGFTLNRRGQNAPNNPEYFALRFTNDGEGEVVHSSLNGSQSFNLVAAPSRELWYDSAPSLSDGWHHLDWFKGFKAEGENWIYHSRHGWLYVSADDTTGMFLSDVALGRWLFTNATVYPWMYAYGPDEVWVFFFEDGRPGSRFFRRADTGEVVAEGDLSVD